MKQWTRSGKCVNENINMKLYTFSDLDDAPATVA